MDVFVTALQSVWADSGYAALTRRQPDYDVCWYYSSLLSHR
jgi:hypothetical protein